jgi:transposase
MLLVGIDWAEAEPAACLLDETGAVRRRLRVPHRAAGLRRLRAAVAAAEPEATAVYVAVERSEGLLVEALVAAGYRVYALNPKAVERYRGRTRIAGPKRDPADAELLARILLTDRARHRPLRPSSPQVAVIRALARDDERASRDERRRLNRLRQDLLAVFPQALAAFPRLTDLSALAFLARWPTAAAAQGLSQAALEPFFRECQHGWPSRAAARVRAAVAAEALSAPPAVAQAKAGALRLAAEQLVLLRRQRGAWRKALHELLAGGARPGHPAGAALLSLPGLDARLAARLLGEVGDAGARFATPAGLQCYAGTAPVTRASGKVRVVAARFACNRFLRQAVLAWAVCSLRPSPWARAFYDRQRQRGKTHHSALRALGNRWLEILHHLLATGQRYDEAVHQRNRARASAAAA